MTASTGVLPVIPYTQCTLKHWSLLCVAFAFRYGEASNPGPEFVLGAFNPTGLGAKHGVVSQLGAGVYGVTETHLTAKGLEDFRLGLKLAKSHFSFLHGHAVSPRARSAVTGAYQGVGFLSSFPSRVLAQAWPAEVYQTSRVQVAGFLIGDVWITGGVCYGYATSKARTGPILDAVIDRVLSQPTGPRFIAGDWNLELHELPQAALLASRGFVEVQDLRAARSGFAPEATCKSCTRKDFVFLSPELQALFCDAFVDCTYWADHALVAAKLTIPSESIPRFVWKQPQHRSQVSEVALHAPFIPGQGTASERFAHVCQAFEDALSFSEVAAGKPPLARCERGRGQVQGVRCRRDQVVPHRKSRDGDLAPEYFGNHAGHAHWFRQLRRIQALFQSLKQARQEPHCLEHRAALWTSVRRAPGFPGSFAQWWVSREVRLQGDPDLVPTSCPDLGICQALFLGLEANFRAFERRLLGRRRSGAKQRRAENPNLIFRDLQLPGKAPVETLVETKRATVAAIDEDSCALELEEGQCWSEGVPFTANGLPLHVIHSEPDKLWVSSLDELAPGMQVGQHRLIGSLIEIFSAFGQEWGKRWMRHETVDTSAWQHLAEGFSNFAPFPDFVPSPITPERWRRALLEKSPKSGPGPADPEGFACIPRGAHAGDFGFVAQRRGKLQLAAAAYQWAHFITGES